MNNFDFLKEISQTRKLVFYGMGKLAEEAFYLLKSNGIDIDFFVDRNYETINKFLGKSVFHYSYLEPKKYYVIVIPLQYYREISSVLIEIGMEENKDFCKWDSLCNQDILYDGIPIGKHSHGFFAYADCLGKSTKNYISSIGRYVSINKTAFMGGDHIMGLTTSHEVYRIAGIEDDIKLKNDLHNRVTIGNDVWIGANTFINASKVETIGNGAIIAAGAVVVTDVPAYAVMCGVPAKVKKYRFSREEIEILESVKWYNWSEEEMKQNKDLFYDKSLFFKRYQKINNN